MLGLLGAHSLSNESIFLDKALELGNRMMPAFETASGLPESYVRLQVRREALREALRH